jgi:hypothetical protein
MQRRLASLLLASLIGAAILLGQQSTRPRVSVRIAPSEPVRPRGDCKSNTAGYLNKDGRTALTNSEIGKFVSENLAHGYVLTMYPAETNNGIFVSAACTNVMSSSAP